MCWILDFFNYKLVHFPLKILAARVPLARLAWPHHHLIQLAVLQQARGREANAASLPLPQHILAAFFFF